MQPRKKIPTATRSRARSTPAGRSQSLEQSRTKIRRRYKADLRKRTKFSPGEQPHVKELCVILKIAGYSHSQIGQVIGSSRGQVREFLDDPVSQELLVTIREAIPKAAITLLMSYSIEAVQTIASIMRESEDDAMVLKAAIEIMDRAGLPKSHKTEASIHSVEETRTTFTDDGITDALRQASPEVQEQAAQIIEQLENLLETASQEESTEEDVTDE